MYLVFVFGGAILGERVRLPFVSWAIVRVHPGLTTLETAIRCCAGRTLIAALFTPTRCRPAAHSGEGVGLSTFVSCLRCMLVMMETFVRCR